MGHRALSFLLLKANKFLKQLWVLANVTQTGANSAFVGDYFQLWINFVQVAQRMWD